MDEEELEVIQDTSMDDGDIRSYFPDAKIMTYNDLNDIEHIDDLLPDDKTYCIILVEQQKGKGHWVCLNKINDKIEFFDSYGGKPDDQLKYTPEENKEMLGLDGKRLTQLLKESGYVVKYNPIKYQAKDGDIKTCGRHVCNRIKQMQKGKTLNAYQDYMDDLKKAKGLDYDEIVSFFFPN